MQDISDMRCCEQINKIDCIMGQMSCCNQLSKNACDVLLATEREIFSVIWADLSKWQQATERITV